LILLTDGAQNGGKVSQTIQASFPVPKGLSSSAACKGKIAFSVPIGKKTVKKKKKTIYAKKRSALKLVGANCAATADLALPESLLGKTLKFTAVFKGSDAIKKFSKSSKHLVAVKLPPPAPAHLFDLQKGPWHISKTPFDGTPVQWSFTLNPDNTISSIRRLNDLSVPCPGGHVDSVLSGPPTEEAFFDSPFKVVADDTTAVDTWTDSEGHETATSTFVLHFDSPTHATGTFKLEGTLYSHLATLNADDLVPGCSTGEITIDVGVGGFA
jgi:hypothetical protein